MRQRSLKKYSSYTTPYKFKFYQKFRSSSNLEMNNAQKYRPIINQTSKSPYRIKNYSSLGKRQTQTTDKKDKSEDYLHNSVKIRISSAPYSQKRHQNMVDYLQIKNKLVSQVEPYKMKQESKKQDNDSKDSRINIQAFLSKNTVIKLSQNDLAKTQIINLFNEKVDSLPSKKNKLEKIIITHFGITRRYQK